MRDQNPVAMFPFPVGILLFNRPAYAEQTLAALAAQEHAIDSTRLVIVRDGFAGSRDELLGDPDLTHEVDVLVERFFPNATYVRFERNLGIALGYEELAAHNFAGENEWAVFFEEDFVADPDYTRVLERLIEAARDAPNVVCLSATGDVAVKRTRGMDTLYPDRHLWAYALRRTMWDESRAVRDAYLELLSPRPYWNRDADAIVSALADFGLMLPGASQDFVKLGFMRSRGYLALNTAQAHGEHIGVTGLHFNETIYSSWGYDTERAPREPNAVIPELSPELLDELERISSVMWARELLGYRLTVGERLAQMQGTLAAVRGQLTATQEALSEAQGELAATRDSLSAGASVVTDGEPSTARVPEIENRGGWTWFGGTSALSIGNVHLLGIVRRKGLSQRGESCLAVIDQSGSVTRTIPLLRGLVLDDHNVPTLVALDQHRFIVAVTGHDDTSRVVVAIGRVRNDTVRVGLRAEIEFSEGTTYAHIVPDGPESFLLLTRCGTTNFRARRISVANLEPLSESMPVFPWAVSGDDTFASGLDGNRPYLITREHGTDVLFALTHDHPRGYRNGIVAGRFRGADIYDLDGTHVHTVSPDAPPWDPFISLTTIVSPGSVDIPWIHDIAPVMVDGAQSGVQVAYSSAALTEREFRFGDFGRHPELRYTVVRRLTGGPVTAVFDTSAGPSLYDGEKHYTGGIALNPRNPDHIMYSVGSIPAREGEPLGVHPSWNLLSREVTGGREQIRLVSSGTRAHSYFRPVFSAMAQTASSHAVFTMRGRYTTYKDFSTRIDATIFEPGPSCVDSNGEHLDVMYPVRLEGAMPSRETRFLRSRLRHSRGFLEFGAGGSTLLALDAGVERVMSVESDVRLAGFLTEIAKGYPTAFDTIVPDIQEISGWGFPVVHGAIDIDGDGHRNMETIGSSYVSSIIDFTHVDTVLIDGRFRVACALHVAMNVTAKTTLLVDDYADRAHYHVVEKYLGRPRMKGRMAAFVLRRPVNVPLEVLSQFFGDAR